MKVQQLKKIKKNFEEVYKESEIKEINIKINGYEIFITEQQAGLDLAEPHVIICTPTGSYHMDFNYFIERLTK